MFDAEHFIIYVVFLSLSTSQYNQIAEASMHLSKSVYHLDLRILLPWPFTSNF